MDQPATSVDLTRGDAYGRSFADVYDRWYDRVTDADATARFVADRANGRPVVELGVGSGRLAEAMVAHHLTVIGLDASAAMLGRCQPLDALTLVRADMRALPFRGPFGVVLIAFNTIFNLATEAEQAGLLAELAAGFDDNSALVIETLDASTLGDGPDRSIGVRSADSPPLVVTATQLDRTAQTVDGQHLEIDDGGISVRPWRLRWLTLDQLDHLAAQAGLRRDERHRSWSGSESESEFGSEFDGQESTISVYRLG